MALQDIVEAGLGQAEVLLGLLSIGWCAVHRGILELVPNTFHHLETHNENLHEKVSSEQWLLEVVEAANTNERKKKMRM